MFGALEGPTRPDERTDLHDNIIRCGCDGSFLYVEGILTDPGGDDGMKIRVYGAIVSLHTIDRTFEE